MRRSVVDESRRRQAAAERRFRGHRIRGGLDELGDLDAPPAQRPRTNSPSTVAKATARPAAAESTTATPSVARSAGTAPLLSSSSAVSTTVFGVDWAEWMEVKRILFDMEATVQAKRAALAKMEVWHLRARKERVVPPYVAATEALVDAVLQDEADTLTDGPLRMCYGAALSRVVHIMTGSFASGNADTYRKRAHEIGFPEEAVEVRQRVAHGALPLTSELRWVCGLVLQFLFTEYWLEQERQLFLMEQVDKTAVVLPAKHDVAAEAAEMKSNKKGGKSGKKDRNAAKTEALQPAAPPPSVSVDDMKALLADLENDDDDAEDGADNGKENLAVEAVDSAVINSAEKSIADVVEEKEKNESSHTSVGGWLLS